MESNGSGWVVDYYDAVRNKSIRLSTAAVVWARPQFVARHVIADLRHQAPSPPVPVNSPWVVANLTVDNIPGGSGWMFA